MARLFVVCSLIVLGASTLAFILSIGMMREIVAVIMVFVKF
jgi:hypothetical protein